MEMLLVITWRALPMQTLPFLHLRVLMVHILIMKEMQQEAAVGPLGNRLPAQVHMAVMGIMI